MLNENIVWIFLHYSADAKPKFDRLQIVSKFLKMFILMAFWIFLNDA